MKSDVNGCSMCPMGEERFEQFGWSWNPNEPRVQYDYRHINGRLFSTIAPSLDVARTRRDQWLQQQAEQPVGGGDERQHGA